MNGSSVKFYHYGGQGFSNYAGREKKGSPYDLGDNFYTRAGEIQGRGGGKNSHRVGAYADSKGKDSLFIKNGMDFSCEAQKKSPPPPGGKVTCDQSTAEKQKSHAFQGQANESFFAQEAIDAELGP